MRSPFRYPGGKTWLVPYVRSWLADKKNGTRLLIEPFAGGGICGLTVAFERLAEHVILGEKDEHVAAVWKTMLTGQGEWLANRILTFELTLDNVRHLLNTEQDGGRLLLRERAFLTILRNRVQRGGIMAPGAGLVKTGENNRGIGSRWYPATLARRIREIDSQRAHLTFVQGDGMALIDEHRVDPEAAIFADPPYTKAAKRLYRHWQFDHEALFKKLADGAADFLLSYDNTEEIQALADRFSLLTRPVKMKNTHHAKMTELLIGRDFSWLDNAIIEN